MYKSAWLLIVFSGFFIIVLPISPIYISTIMALVGMFFYILNNEKIYVNRTLLISVAFIIYLILSQNIGVTLTTNALYNVIFSLSYFILSYLAIYNLTCEQINNIAKTFINVSIILLIIEACWRVTHPYFSPVVDYYKVVEDSFYKYKFSSIMYQDSNFVGIFIVSLFFFSIYLKKYQNIKLNCQLFILAILSLLTFSRASIMVIVLLYIFLGIKSVGKRIGISLILLLLGTTIIFKYVSNDGGFLARIYIVNTMWNFITNTSYHNVFYGVGFGNTVNYLGIGAHNLIVTYLIESGLIGLILLMLLWYKILRQTKLRAGIIMIPFLFNAMSLSGHAIPYLYCIFAVVCVLEKKQILIKNSNIADLKL